MIGSRLKKWPPLYNAALRVYYSLRPVRLMELLVGTRATEREWASRHMRKGNDWGYTRHNGNSDDWVLSYWDSQEHTHRPLLVERISSYYPFSSVLEVGCNCGPNLYLLARKFPDAMITGIDINPRAVQKGSELFTRECISNVKLLVGKADELGQFPDKSFDIVFTDATLIYIGPDKIREVISELVRIAGKGIVLLEQNCFESGNKPLSSLGISRLGVWQRDYAALLKQFIPDRPVKVTRISKDVWPGEQWQETGAIIEVAL